MEGLDHTGSKGWLCARLMLFETEKPAARGLERGFTGQKIYLLSIGF